MVKFDLSVLITFKEQIHRMPIEIPKSKRRKRLLEEYEKISGDNVELVSVQVPSSFESYIEKHIDETEPKQKQLILHHLIDKYTNSNHAKLFDNNFSLCFANRRYLVPTVNTCLKIGCCKAKLQLCRPSKTNNSTTIFYVNGIGTSEVYRKKCPSCKSEYYYSYWEYSDGDKIQRRYYNNSNEVFFALTNDTIFEKKLLDDLTEDIVTCYVQFANWVTAYNKKYPSSTDRKLHRKVLVSAWLLHSIEKRIPLKFDVVRDTDRHLDIEQVCKSLYPSLRQFVDKKWLSHVCEKCSTRLVVMDGDAKAYR